MDYDAVLRGRCQEVVKHRFGADVPEPVSSRLDTELELLRAHGLAPMLLLGEAVYALPSVRNTVHGETGSGAYSYAAYLLKITELDPLEEHMETPEESYSLDPKRMLPFSLRLTVPEDRLDAVRKETETLRGFWNLENADCPLEPDGEGYVMTASDGRSLGTLILGTDWDLGSLRRMAETGSALPTVSQVKNIPFFLCCYHSETDRLETLFPDSDLAHAIWLDRHIIFDFSDFVFWCGLYALGREPKSGEDPLYYMYTEHAGTYPVFADDVIHRLCGYGMAEEEAVRIADILRRQGGRELPDILQESAVPQDFRNILRNADTLVSLGNVREQAFVKCRLLWYKLREPSVFYAAMLRDMELTRNICTTLYLGRSSIEEAYHKTYAKYLEIRHDPENAALRTALLRRMDELYLAAECEERCVWFLPDSEHGLTGLTARDGMIWYPESAEAADSTLGSMTDTGLPVTIEL